MLAPRATMFMSRGNYGFTESHYYMGPGDLRNLVPAAVNLCSLRADLLAPNTSLDYLRLSLDDTFRDSLIIPIGIPGSSRYLTVAPPAYDALNVRLDAGGERYLYRSIQFLGGMPDLVFRRVAAGNDPPFGWNRRYQRYQEELLARWGLLVQTRDDADNPPLPITFVANQGAQLLILCPNHSFQPGDIAHITNVRVKKGLSCNGNRIVTAIAGRSGFFITNGSPAFVYSGGGRARLHTWGLRQYNTITLMRTGSRLRGHHYLPASWEPVGEPLFPINPCGMIVDLLHSFYKTGMVFSADGTQVQVVRWYKCAKGASPAPYGLWGSSAWHNVRSDFSVIGEVPTGHLWDAGKNKAALLGICHIGTDEQWASGLSAHELKLRPRLEVCCGPLEIVPTPIGLAGGGLCPVNVVTEVCPVILAGVLSHLVVEHRTAYLECWRLNGPPFCTTDPSDCCTPSGNDDMLLVYTAANMGATPGLPGQPIAMDASGVGWIPAVASGVGTQAVGLLAQATPPGFSGNVQIGGYFSLADWSSILDDGAPGLIPRGTYFLSPTPGKLTLTPPTITGQIVQVVGRAISATWLELVDSEPVLL